MERTLISQASRNIGKEILIKGRIINLREMGGISFVLIQDYSGVIQTVWEKETEAKMGDAVAVVGSVRKDERAKGGFEIVGKEMKIVATSIQDYPFDLSKSILNLQLTTLLDNRALSLRHPRAQAIFKLHDILLQSYEEIMRREGFNEIKTPKLLEAASEGGGDFFQVRYYDRSAYLAQSPQLYKQIMVGVFERVFEIGSVFRAEPSFTTRHLSEYISLDAEMGFIENFYDVTAMLNKILRQIFQYLSEKGEQYLKLYNVKTPEVPEKIPHLKLSEMKEIIKKKYKYTVPEDTDIDPEGERLACQYAKEEYNCDFLFLTHYPWEHRPFYTMSDKDNPKETTGFDLIFRGVELVTGSQRIHLYDTLVANMEKKNVKPKGLEFYLEVFKYAMPPHGGWAIGSERLIQQLLGLKNVKEAVLFPRDVKRLSP